MLNVSENKIEELPYSMGLCQSLGFDTKETISIDLSENPLKVNLILMIPQSVERLHPPRQSCFNELSSEMHGIWFVRIICRVLLTQQLLSDLILYLNWLTDIPISLPSMLPKSKYNSFFFCSSFSQIHLLGWSCEKTQSKRREETFCKNEKTYHTNGRIYHQESCCTQESQ